VEFAFVVSTNLNICVEKKKPFSAESAHEEPIQEGGKR
jgi:hypothetical protein